MLFKKSDRIKKVLGKFDLYTVKLGSLLEAYTSNAIQGYINNRGSKGVSLTRVKQLAQTFKVDGLNCIGITRLDEGGFEVVDGHTRLAAAIKTMEDENLTKEDLNVEVPIMVCIEDDKKELYSLLNNTKGHNANSVLTNPDFPIGQLIQELAMKSDIDDPPNTRMADVSKIPYSFYNQIANVMNALSRHKKELNFDDNEGSTWNFVTNNSSREVNNIIKFQPLEEVLVPTNADKKRVVEALVWMSDYYGYLYESAFTEDGRRHDSIFDQVKLLCGSAGWFGTLLTCLLSEEKSKPIIKTRDAFTFAQTCLEKGSKLTSYTGDFTRNPLPSFVEVNKILSRRSNKRK